MYAIAITRHWYDKPDTAQIYAGEDQQGYPTQAAAQAVIDEWERGQYETASGEYGWPTFRVTIHPDQWPQNNLVAQSLTQ